MAATAKVFMSGRSQAVRLPKDFRFEGSEVYIRREGECVILEPMEKTLWPQGFWSLFPLDPEFSIPEPLATKEVDLDAEHEVHP